MISPRRRQRAATNPSRRRKCLVPWLG